MQPVIVVWADAWGEDKQVETAVVDHHPVMTQTIGFLVKADEVGITVSMDSYPDTPEEVRNTAFIPRGMIREVIHLNLPIQ